MTFTVKPFSPGFACEITGVDLRTESTPETAEATMNAMDRYGVSVFRDQKIDDRQQIAFSRLFGNLEHSPNFGRASRDRFFLCIESQDPRFSVSDTRKLLESYNPEEITEVPY